MASVKTSAATLTPQERRCKAETSLHSCCNVDGGNVCAWTGHGASAHCNTVQAAKKQHWINQCPTPNSKRKMLGKDPAIHQAAYKQQKAKQKPASQKPPTVVNPAKAAKDRAEAEAQTQTEPNKPNLKPTPRQHVPPQVVR